MARKDDLGMSSPHEKKKDLVFSFHSLPCCDSYRKWTGYKDYLAQTVWAGLRHIPSKQFGHEAIVHGTVHGIVHGVHAAEYSALDWLFFLVAPLLSLGPIPVYSV